MSCPHGFSIEALCDDCNATKAANTPMLLRSGYTTYDPERRAHVITAVFLCGSLLEMNAQDGQPVVRAILDFPYVCSTTHNNQGDTEMSWVVRDEQVANLDDDMLKTWVLFHAALAQSGRMKAKVRRTWS